MPAWVWLLFGGAGALLIVGVVTYIWAVRNLSRL